MRSYVIHISIVNQLFICLTMIFITILPLLKVILLYNFFTLKLNYIITFVVLK